MEIDEYVDEELAEEEESEVPGWAKNAAKKAAKLKIVNLNFLHSHVQADRLSAAVMIAKGIPNLVVPESIDSSLFIFKDVDSIPADDLRYIVALKNYNYIQGDPDGNFNPDSSITRAEIAAILARIAETVDEEAPDEGTPDEGTPDEGTPDEGTPDEGTPDEGTPDEETPDEGTPDEGTPDEGTPVENQ